jgi:glycosyltransferase involved in cell wall biosynthesis
MSQPRISVIMPVRNGDRFVAETVDGILAQTFTDWELIVVDGGSTDRTLEILSGFKDSRIRIFEQPLEITPARNFGIAQAKSPWIAVHDSDDISLPRRLELQWQALNRLPNSVLSYTDVNFIGNINTVGGRARFPKTQAYLAMRLCYQLPMVHTTMMFNRERWGDTPGGGQRTTGWWGGWSSGARQRPSPKNLLISGCIQLPTPTN